MTDQPTKGPWKIVKYPTATYVEIPGKSGFWFLDEDRDANARLFIRAQHMDELVGAARKIRTRYGETMLLSDLLELDSILAKIKGEK